MKTTTASIRALRTVAFFATGVAAYTHASAFAQLPGWPRLLQAAQRLAHARAQAATPILNAQPGRLTSRISEIRSTSCNT